MTQLGDPDAGSLLATVPAGILLLAAAWGTVGPLVIAADAALAVDAVLAVLQKFDPPGVCARNLSECLAIQLRELDRYDPAMQALVEHLDLLAKRDIASLRKLCGVDDEDITDMIGEIRRLDPKPGLKFGSARTQTMVPDVYVRPGPDGGWHVELNSDTLPRVLVNQIYYTELSKNIRKDGDKSYFSDCLQNATWLVRALDQRARTILKVATEIVRQQDGFLAFGVEHLRPLNLKTVADANSSPLRGEGGLRSLGEAGRARVTGSCDSTARALAASRAARYSIRGGSFSRSPGSRSWGVVIGWV